MTRWLLLAVLASSAAHAVAPTTLTPARPACEAFVDQRELRYRPPTATITGHVVAGSVKEDRPEAPEVGMQLVLGSAVIVEDNAPGRQFPVSYAYWLTNLGCDGWEPARGQAFIFDLVDDKAKDGALRVMRYGRGLDSPR